MRKRVHEAAFLLRSSDAAWVEGTYTSRELKYIYCISDSKTCYAIGTKIKNRTSKWRVGYHASLHANVPAELRAATSIGADGEKDARGCEVVWLLELPGQVTPPK